MNPVKKANYLRTYFYPVVENMRFIVDFKPPPCSAPKRGYSFSWILSPPPPFRILKIVNEHLLIVLSVNLKFTQAKLMFGQVPLENAKYAAFCKDLGGNQPLGRTSSIKQINFMEGLHGK
jgi:hypothetical protein